MNNKINPIKDTIKTDTNTRSELIKLIRDTSNQVEFNIHDVAKNMGIPEFRNFDNMDMKFKKSQIFWSIMEEIKEELTHICAADVF